jgi:hypothetical protein
MNSLKDANIFNVVNPSALEPKSKKPYPFPLENFDSEISDAYSKMNDIYNKLKAAGENPLNDTKAKKRRLESLEYKTKTCLGLIRDISKQCSELWF